jgi:hypothetical protein
MDPVAKFADEVAAFERWLLTGTDREADAARQCLIRLLELYRAAIDLPPAWSDELERRADVERVDDAEWQKACEASRRIPLNYYSDVFDPTEPPSDAAVVGSISDDLADIYRDTVTGLRAYRRGDRAGAVWEWSFGLHSHWGAHATGAIRALHWWLCNNAQDHLSVAKDVIGGPAAAADERREL